MSIEYTTEETKLIPWNQRRQIEKKVLPQYYKGIRTHKKMFEIRKDEDGIRPGDLLVLREWDGEKYTGGCARREVTAVLRDCPECGLMEGYCILSLQVPGWDDYYPQACLDGTSTGGFDPEHLTPQDKQDILDALDYLKEKVMEEDDGRSDKDEP